MTLTLFDVSFRSDSEIASEAPTAEDLSLGGASIKSDDGVVTADDMSKASSEIHTEPEVKEGHTRTAATSRKSIAAREGDSIFSDFQ